MEQIPYIDGMNLGLGYNSAAQSIHSPALNDVTSTKDVPSAGGQDVSFSLEMTSNSASLAKQIGLSATASLKYGISGSGSFKASFVNSIKQNSFSVYLVVQVNVINKQTLLDLSKVRLKTEADIKLVNNPAKFIQQHGDSFIYGLITGGEFYGVLEIESSSAEEHRKTKAELSGKASFGLFSGSASASFEQAMSNITSDYQMKATIFRKGGTGMLLNEITPSKLIEAALQFPETVKGENGYAFQALTIPYNNIEHSSASPISVANQADKLRQLGTFREQFIRCQNDLSYASSHPEQFPGIKIELVSERFNKISNQIDEIVKAASSCFSDQSKCQIPTLDLSLLKLSDVIPLQQKGDSNMKIATHRLFVGQPSEPNPLGSDQEFRFKPSDAGTVPRLRLKHPDGNDKTFGKRVIGTWFTLHSHAQKFAGINYAGAAITETNKVEFYSNDVQGGFIVEVYVLYEE